MFPNHRSRASRVKLSQGVAWVEPGKSGQRLDPTLNSAAYFISHKLYEYYMLGQSSKIFCSCRNGFANFSTLKVHIRNYSKTFFMTHCNAHIFYNLHSILSFVKNELGHISFFTSIFHDFPLRIIYKIWAIL